MPKEGVGKIVLSTNIAETLNLSRCTRLCQTAVDVNKKKPNLNQLETLETELESADIMTGAVITNRKAPDNELTVKQLFYRYKDYSRQTCKTLYLMDYEKINLETLLTVTTATHGKDRYWFSYLEFKRSERCMTCCLITPLSTRGMRRSNLFRCI